MIDLDVVAFGVSGGECTPGTHIGYFANDLNRLRFPLLVDRVGILDFKTRNDAAMRQGNAIGLFFERLFVLAFTARAIPSPEAGRRAAAGAGRDRGRQTPAHGG
jgi:hypothetical protein